MTINIQKCSNVTVVGHRTSKNCKSLYDIDGAKFYASGMDLAEAFDVSPSSVSYAINNEGATCKGHRIIPVSSLLDNLELINEVNRTLVEKAAAYDAEAARRSLVAKAEADVQKREETVAELRRQLEEAEGELNTAKHGLLELQSGN